MSSLLRPCAFLVCVVLLARPVAAQTSCSANCTLTVGQSYTLAADHDGVNTDGYRIIIDGVQVGADLPLAALVAGVVTSGTLTAPARGSHTVGIMAFNVDGAALSSLVSLATKKAPPGKPGNPRILSRLASPFRIFANRSHQVTFSALKHEDGSVSLRLSPSR